jgi:hypothetical protein
MLHLCTFLFKRDLFFFVLLVFYALANMNSVIFQFSLFTEYSLFFISFRFSWDVRTEWNINCFSVKMYRNS